MERIYKKDTKPNLRTKKFSTLHIEIFEQILTSDKTNRQLNVEFGYTRKSHCVVDHSRKVMYKLLTLENLKKETCMDMVIYPRSYKLWWRNMMSKHKKTLLTKAVLPEYYDEEKVKQLVNERKQASPWNYYLN